MENKRSLRGLQIQEKIILLPLFLNPQPPPPPPAPISLLVFNIIIPYISSFNYLRIKYTVHK